MKKRILGISFVLAMLVGSFNIQDAEAQVIVDTTCKTKGHSTWYGFDCDGSGSTTCYVKCPDKKKNEITNN